VLTLEARVDADGKQCSMYRVGTLLSVEMAMSNARLIHRLDGTWLDPEAGGPGLCGVCQKRVCSECRERMGIAEEKVI
jgi:hypothetical protein